MILKHIIIGEKAKEPLSYINTCEAIKGFGLKGDRYYYNQGTFNNKKQLNQNVREISIFSYDDLEIVNQKTTQKLNFLDLRRNLIIKDFDYNKLKDKEFQIGSVKFKIVRTCPPCKYLSRLLNEDMMSALKYIGGYRAKILQSGVITIEDKLIIL